ACLTWLHRMAVNVVLMRLRRKGLQVVPIEETVETEEETPKKELGGQDPVLAGSIDRLQMQKAVGSLPPGYRTIFVLHDVEGYEHNEIAEIVGCSIGNRDRKSTRLNSSHQIISYAVFFLKKKM